MLGGAGALAVSGVATWAYMPGGYLTRDARWFRAIKADPMASNPLLGRTAVRVREHGPAGLFDIKRTTPWIDHYFRDDSIGPHTLAEELITHAQKVGWTHDTTISIDNSWTARREHNNPDGTMTLTIMTITDINPTSFIYGTAAVTLH
ncbi:Uncharacterised protein [Actinomyces howellii]|uniref:Uncharacterized protein n=2 Tax=Actinomyces howellii TaxID=52771 RepID=A0A448HJA9_9ACTO|nr:Uncharacterised protein [Actinomyces howellii]